MNNTSTTEPSPVAEEAQLPGLSPTLSLSKWFAEHVQPHDSQLKAYLRGSFPSVRDVDDIVQESYLRVWRRQAARPIETVKAFLFKVARHLALNTVRHERVSPFLAVTESAVSRVVDERPGIAEQVCTHEEVMILFAAIDALPNRCREVYILRKLKGLSQKEIARQLGISEQTVEVQIVRANHRCEAFLRERGVLRA